MPLLVVGISHHTAPLEVREKLAIASDAYSGRVEELREHVGASEAVIVSTCNRTECYSVVHDGQEERLLAWLRHIGGLETDTGNELFYVHEGREAVHHLFSVACGLDSMVLGEPQILGQLKDAWRESRAVGGVGKITDRLFQRAFAVSKNVRTHTGINDHPVSVAYITSVLARQIFRDLSNKTVLLVGAGEMMTLCGQHFRQQGIGALFIANRSRDRAASLAGELDATALSLHELPEHLADADIVVSSTAANAPIIATKDVKTALKSRRQRPVFMVDLGVPRDIEPSAGKLRDVYLYTIDDLRQVADESLSRREKAAREALVTIDREVVDYLRWFHGARAAQSLKHIRLQAERNGSELAARALRQLEAGGDPSEVVQQLSNTLTHRILHGPSKRLREAAEQQHDDILRAADWLFDDPDNGPEDT